MRNSSSQQHADTLFLQESKLLGFRIGPRRAWCPYCILDALTHFATVAFTLPESAAAVEALRR